MLEAGREDAMSFPYPLFSLVRKAALGTCILRTESDDLAYELWTAATVETVAG